MSIVKSVKSFFADLESFDVNENVSHHRPLVVAVSGGPDSVALLHILAKRRVYSPSNIVVAHLDHSLRPSSTAEAQFVQALAGDWQLQFRTKSADVQELANRKRISIETAAREARYAFLTEIAREFGADSIATGHNQNDQAETVLMHIIRGVGLTGLRGMRSVSTVPDAKDLRLLRPLLSVSRDSIEAYCRRNELRYVEDESNRDVSMFRNHLRHKLLPALMEDNPHIVAKLSNLASIIDADEDLLDQILEDSWSSVVTDVSRTRIAMDLKGWRTLALSMRRRILRSGFSRLRPGNIELSFETTELARRVAETGNTGDQVMLSGDVLLEIEYGQLVLQTSDHLASVNDWPQLRAGTSHILPVPGELRLDGGWIISARRSKDTDFDVITNNRDNWCAYIRAAFAEELIVRTQKEGERLRPLGMGGKSAKILDIMSNRKIAKHWRERWPILACWDYPLWIVGHLMDERAAITPDDQDVLLVRLRRTSSVDEP